jgi:hypothetical protein
VCVECGVHARLFFGGGHWRKLDVEETVGWMKGKVVGEGMNQHVQ